MRKILELQQLEETRQQNDGVLSISTYSPIFCVSNASNVIC